MQSGSFSPLPYWQALTTQEQAQAVRPVLEEWCSEVGVDQLLELVVEDKHQGTAGSTQHVGEGALLDTPQALTNPLQCI